MNQPLVITERYRTMTSLPKRVLFASIGLMAIVILASILDIATGWTFAAHWGMDIVFLITAAIVIYLGIDALREQK
jgi:peptidoglycan/LPS O-acetylase OafA/YrhL